ncbi:MAG: response regulator [Coleofasciculaceae cyanobacterium]
MSVKILVVEDEAITSEVIAEQLEELGYTVTDTVMSGSEAIASTAQTVPDLVLMDISLGGDMDGIAAAAKIREKFHLPVVYLTAHSDDATLERAQVTEPFGYIIKPYSERDLRVAIKNALYKHRLERQLVAEKEMLYSILHSTNDAVIATNEKGTLTYMNPTAEVLTGFPVTKAYGQAIGEIVQLVDQVSETPLENPALQVLRKGKVVNQENLALITKSGSKTPIIESSYPIVQENGAITGVVTVMQALSQLQQESAVVDKEQLTTAKRKNLSREVEHRSLLAFERELSELKSRLITTISQEFRSSLSVVLTSAEIMKNSSSALSPEKQERNLSRIQAAVGRMTEIVQDVLSFSKAEAGELKCNPAPLEVEDFCRNLIEEQQIRVKSSYILNFVAEDSCGSIELDEQLLRSMLTNLLNNALDNSSEGGNISLTLCKEDEQVVFKIKDHGAGIALAAQQKLSSASFGVSHVDTLQDRITKLSIVRKCVELHGGEITFSNEAGVGTTFIIKLPFGSVKSPYFNRGI